MNLDALPTTWIFCGFFCYQAYTVYDFQTNPDSDLNQKKHFLENVKKNITEKEKAVARLEEFEINLEKKKEELKFLAQELNSLKIGLSENEDVPSLIKSIATEAKRVGLFLLSMAPTKSTTQEYYVEQNFDIRCKGLYFQLIAFFEELNRFTNIVLADALALSSTNQSRAGYPEIDGIIQIKSFKYLATAIDGAAYDEKGFTEILKRIKDLKEQAEKKKGAS